MQDQTNQANLPIEDPLGEPNKEYIRPPDKIRLHDKVPPEPSSYMKGKNYSSPWILQDGRQVDEAGSEMKDKFKMKVPPKPTIGIRKRMLTNFYWEQVLDELVSSMSSAQPVTEYCSEYDANFVKENFQPRELDVTTDKDKHLKYPLYGTGASAITFYSQTIKNTGPGEILEPFRRCQYFTRPMEDRLDNGWVL